VGRRTNLALLLLLLVAFLSGWLAFAYATAPARWSLIAHATAGFAIVLLLPWKSAISRRGVERRRPGWWASVLFGILVLASLLAGLAHSTGALLYAADLTAMEVHVGAAIAAVPFGIWHVLARPVRVRPTDLQRRRLLQASVVVGIAGAGYAMSEGLVRLARLPGAARRFTGSYEMASFQPELMPVTQWMFDGVPAIQAAGWTLRVATGGRVESWTYDRLVGFDDRVRATLDCTGGFFSVQDWQGVWLSRLLPPGTRGQSIHVRSLTGYDRRFGLDEASRLLVATGMGGRPLDSGHGFPVRLVAPDRRGFSWIKWVSSIEVDEAPVWWQLPFPLQ
jgi:DMSO/TMAO reductase YedYZ molybdopterin-dependent catalytic subunit